MLRKIAICLLIISTTCVYTQNKKYKISDYKEGFYNTVEDFINNKVSPSGEIKPKLNFFDNKFVNSGTPDVCYFSRVADTSKVTKIFAISYKGALYIRDRYISKYAIKGKGNQSTGHENKFIKVQKDGNFLYLEAEIANNWSKGLAYGGIGGAVGASIGSNLNALKGIIFDFETKKFDVIRNCNDLKKYITDNKLNDNINCKSFNIQDTRRIVDITISQ